MLKQKTILLTTILFVLLGINACNEREVILPSLELSATTLSQIAAITEVVKANPEMSFDWMDGVAQEMTKRGRQSSDELPAELKAALDSFHSDPSKALLAIASEHQGAEKIALLEGLFTQKDAVTLKKRAEVFVAVEIPPTATVGMLGKEAGTNNGRIGCSGDCKLHVMAGAGIAMGVSAAVYAGATWFTWQIKAAMIVAVGISAGILFGAAKELWDYVRNGNQVSGIHGVQWRDFWNTVIGSFAGGAISFGVIMVSPHPIIAVAVMGAGSIYLGMDLIRCCVFKLCGC